MNDRHAFTFSFYLVAFAKRSKIGVTCQVMSSDNMLLIFVKGILIFTFIL